MCMAQACKLHDRTRASSYGRELRALRDIQGQQPLPCALQLPELVAADDEQLVLLTTPVVEALGGLGSLGGAML